MTIPFHLARDSEKHTQAQQVHTHTLTPPLVTQLTPSLLFYFLPFFTLLQHTHIHLDGNEDRLKATTQWSKEPVAEFNAGLRLCPEMCYSSLLGTDERVISQQQGT